MRPLTSLFIQYILSWRKCIPRLKILFHFFHYYFLIFIFTYVQTEDYMVFLFQTLDFKTFISRHLKKLLNLKEKHSISYDDFLSDTNQKLPLYIKKRKKNQCFYSLNVSGHQYYINEIFKMTQACAYKTFTLYYVPAFHNISDCILIKYPWINYKS